MCLRLLPLAVLFPVLLAAWLTSIGKQNPRAVAEDQVVSYSALLRASETAVVPSDASDASVDVASAE